jgi:hypothetical protein
LHHDHFSATASQLPAQAATNLPVHPGRAMTVNFRLYRDDDAPALRTLWEGSSDWGALSDDLFQRYVIDAPNGGPLICVATDESDVPLGAMTFQRKRAWCGGREVLAVRPAAPIVSEALRQRFRSLNPLDHPVVRMVSHTQGILRDQGVAFTYMLPHPQWRMLLKLMPGVVCAQFPLWSTRVPLDRPFMLEDGFEAAPLTSWGDPVDALWRQASSRIECGVVRDSAQLKQMSGPPDYDVLGLYHAGDLAGVACARQHGDRQWLICDLLAVDAVAERQLLMAACNRAHEMARTGEAGPLNKAALLVTHGLMEHVIALGFQRDRYDFTFAVRPLSDAISRDDLAAERWYLSAND